VDSINAAIHTEIIFFIAKFSFYFLLLIATSSYRLHVKYKTVCRKNICKEKEGQILHFSFKNIFGFLSVPSKLLQYKSFHINQTAKSLFECKKPGEAKTSPGFS